MRPLFFPFSDKSWLFIGFKICEEPKICCSRPSHKRSGSTPELTSQSTLHACLERVNASFEGYKMAGFVRRRKEEEMAAMHFEQAQAFILAKKIFWA